MLEGDRAAGEELCGRLHGELRPRIHRAVPAVDPHVLDAALDDVLVEHLIQNPGQYDPERASLRNYFTVAVLNRARDILRSHRRREHHERPTGIDLSTVAGPAEPEADEQQRMDDIRWIQMRLYSVVETEAERALVELKLANAPTVRDGRSPVTATRGQVHWSIGGGGTARGIVGQIEHVDLARGVSSAYACPQATNDIFVDAWIDPDLQTIAVGGSELYVAWERDEDAWGGGLQSHYEITDILSWQSWNSSVAVIVSVGSDVAEVGGVANGFTGIRATGDSNGWAEYDPGEEDPENHVPVSLFADAQVTAAYPTNLRLTSITYFNGSSNSHPLPTIYANYTWDSSTGNRSHLGACEIWEDLDYGTWNSPPFYGQPSDNQLWMADGPDQGFQDIHGTQGPLLMDNGQPVAGSGPLTQRYKFKCTTIQNNALQDITGPDAGPHSVTRETTVNGSNWFFSISKHGNSASCQLRTSSTAGWCQ